MNRWLAALAALTALRLLVAATTPLSPDEAYYWVWSHALAPGYLDHPPMVALWIKAGTLLAGETDFGIRLLAPVAGAFGSLLLVQAGNILVPGTGVIAAALLNATLLFGVGSVVMTPDTPLLFFWTATLWALARLVRSGRARWFLAIGVFAGLALASKYTAVFLLAGIFLWLVATPAMRFWLRRPAPWVGALLAAAVFMPVILWNAANGWASFLKQGGRTGDWAPARALRYLGELLGSQLGLATPLVFLICMAGMVAAARLAWRGRDPGWSLLAMLTVPPALVFVQHAFGDRVQGNWPAILYPAAAIAGAGLTGPFWMRLRRPALGLGLVMTLAVYAQATLGLAPIPPRLDPTMLRLAGWNGLAANVANAARTGDASFIASDEYGIASELAHDLPAGLPVVGAERRWSLFDLGAMPIGGRVGLLVRSGRRGGDPDRGAWADVEEIGGVSRGRDGVAAEDYRLFRVVGRPGGMAVLLPHPNLPAAD